MGPGSGAGATVGVAPPSVPVNDPWYQLSNGVGSAKRSRTFFVMREMLLS